MAFISFSVFICFFGLFAFAFYEAVSGWESRSEKYQATRPTVLTTEIHFNADINDVINHKLTELNDVKVKTCVETKTIYFREKFALFETGFVGLFNIKSSSPISGVIKLSMEEHVVVGKVEGKIPINQAIIVLLMVVGGALGGLFALPLDFEVCSFLFLFSAFGLLISALIYALEKPKFINRIDRIVKSYNDAGIPTTREDFTFTLFKKNRINV